MECVDTIFSFTCPDLLDLEPNLDRLVVGCSNFTFDRLDVDQSSSIRNTKFVKCDKLLFFKVFHSSVISCFFYCCHFKLLSIWGLFRLSVLETIFGMVIVVLGKSWFLDRMVWLYNEMKDTNPDYRSWFY